MYKCFYLISILICLFFAGCTKSLDMKLSHDQLINVDKDHGIIIGSVKSKAAGLWPGALATLSISEKSNLLEIGTHHLDFRLGGEEQAFVARLPVGEYGIGLNLYTIPIIGFDIHFAVKPAEIIYIGTLEFDVPSYGPSTTAEILDEKEKTLQLAGISEGELGRTVETCLIAEVVESVPTNHYENGVGYAIKGKFKAARGEFEKVLETNPLNFKARTNLTIVEHAITQKIKGLTAILLFKANEHIEKGEFENAIPVFDRAIRLNPEYAISYASRGSAYFRNDLYDPAISDYKKAITLDPDLPWIKTNISMAIVYKKASLITDTYFRSDSTGSELLHRFRQSALDEFKKMIIQNYGNFRNVAYESYNFETIWNSESGSNQVLHTLKGDLDLSKSSGALTMQFVSDSLDQLDLYSLLFQPEYQVENQALLKAAGEILETIKTSDAETIYNSASEILKQQITLEEYKPLFEMFKKMVINKVTKYTYYKYRHMLAEQSICCQVLYALRVGEIEDNAFLNLTLQDTDAGYRFMGFNVTLKNPFE